MKRHIIKANFSLGKKMGKSKLSFWVNKFMANKKRLKATF